MLLAVVLSGVSGFLDAVGYLYLGGFFISFMSGNSTKMAASAAEGMWPSAGRALGVIGLFFLGVIAGSVMSRVGDGRATVLWATTGVVTVAAAAHTAGVTVPAVLLLAVAMGVLNSTFQRGGEVSIGLTYMTGTLVKAGQRLVDAAFGGPRYLWLRYVMLWLALTSGAVAGAYSYTRWHLTVLWGAAAVLAATAAVTTIVRAATRTRPSAGGNR
ncbi:YoaK family protein [Tsukamurella soli]|uniref:YoaK family protein n=1 Tax=Tsukamurella soli TaxID=644556 RepID=UPI003CD08D8F